MAVFSANVDLGTVGASITDVTLYPCTGSTESTDCSATPIPNYQNVPKWTGSTPVTGITGTTTYIKIVSSGGGCSTSQFKQVVGIPGVATMTPTPTAGANPTPSPTPTATAGANPTPSPTPTQTALPYSQFTIYTDSSTAPTGYTSSEAACGGSGAAPQTVYVQGTYSSLSAAYTDGRVLYTTSGLNSNAIFNGYGTWYKTTNQSDAGGSLRVSAVGEIELYNTCPGPLTFTATTDLSAYGEYANPVNGNNVVTVTVTTSRSAIGSYIWWAKHSGTATYDDFENDHTSPMLISAATGHTFELIITEDEFTEGSQTFSVGILTGTTSPPTAGGEVAYTPTFTIADDSITPQYRYAVLQRIRDYNGGPCDVSASNDTNYYWDQQTNGTLDGSDLLYSGGGYCYRVVSFTNDFNSLGNNEISGASLNNCLSCPD